MCARGLPSKPVSYAQVPEEASGCRHVLKTKHEQHIIMACREVTDQSRGHEESLQCIVSVWQDDACFGHTSREDLFVKKSAPITRTAHG